MIAVAQLGLTFGSAEHEAYRKPVRNSCPVCGSGDVRLVGQRCDRVSADYPWQVFEIVECLGECRALHTRYPDGWDVHALYASDRYHVTRQIEVRHPLYEDRFEHDCLIAADRLARVSAYRPMSPGDTLIDAGCSNGALVASSLKLGYDAYGCDISPYILEKARKNLSSTVELKLMQYRLVVHNMDIEPIALAGHFDVVQCNDVIEHSVNTTRFLTHLAAALKPGGLMFVDTPDFEDAEFLEQGLEWRHVRPIEHTVNLHEPSLRYLASRVGLTIVDFYRPIPGKIVMVARR